MRAPTLALALALGAPAASHAGLFSGRDDCAPGTRHARCEWEAELRNARRFESMDCCGLAAYGESLRAGFNRQIQATYHRPVAERPAPDRPLPPPPATPPDPPDHAEPRTPQAQPPGDAEAAKP